MQIFSQIHNKNKEEESHRYNQAKDIVRGIVEQTGTITQARQYAEKVPVFEGKLIPA
jgi:hypothetical protein